MRLSALLPWALAACTAGGSGSDPPATLGSPVQAASGASPDPLQVDPRDSGDVVVPAPPRLGPGFVDLSAPLLLDPLVVDPGDPGPPLREPQPAPVQFGDLDGDGVPEVIAHAADAAGGPGLRQQVRVLRWTVAGLVRDAALEAEVAEGGGEVRAVLDLDGDGWVDLVGAEPLDGVRWGLGAGRFAPWTPILSASPLVRRGVNALSFLDVDDDGWTDLVVGSATCMLEAAVALRVGPRTFALRSDVLASGRGGYVSDAILAARTLEGTPSLLSVHDENCAPDAPHPGFLHVVGTLSDGLPRFGARDATPADAWWKRVPQFAGRAMPHLTPMGAGLGDVDHDGRLDLAVSVGIEQQVLLLGGAAGYVDGSEASGLLRATAPNGEVEFPWAFSFLELDGDGHVDLVATIGDDEGSFIVRDGAPMRNAVYLGRGDGSFEDATDASGLDQRGSWRSLDLDDVDGDGDADLAMGGFGDAPVVVRNDVREGGLLSLRLVGRTSDPLAVGAWVQVEAPGLPLQLQMVQSGGNPFVARPTPLVFAVPEGGATAEVHWPSGHVQTVAVANGGALVVEEPLLIEVLDADRAVPADGTSTIEVRVRPVDGGGRPLPDAVVEATLEGLGTLLAAEPAADGVTLRVQAPGVVGSARLTVHIDGVALRTRPRLGFTPP